MKKIITRIIMTWVVLFILFFVLTQPSGAARYLHDWYNGVHAAASSLAKLANSF